jgi:8-oxo-dGTP pyrophosphatase MutT (NUDIX family)
MAYTFAMKQLTVVFPVFVEDGKNLILMGKQAPGKKMPGIRNGFGGKCEEGESPEDCAVREVREESGVDLKKEDLNYIGKIIEGEKHVYFYTTQLDSKIMIDDNDEMIDCRWFDIENQADYIHEMLPGNEPLMLEVAHSLRTPDTFEPFVLDMSGNKELVEATKNIYDKS